MSLLDVLRTGVRIADQITRPVQALVTYEQMVLSGDGYGTKLYPSSIQIRAIVDETQAQVRTREGILTMRRASVMFLDVAALALATGSQGIGVHDRITLPDGTTGPILNTSGFVDAGTGQPLATEVSLG